MKRPLLVYIIAALAVVAGIYLYRPHNLFFLADDFIHIPESTGTLLTQRNSLRPVGNISLYINELWSGTSAFGYHLFNLVLHGINSHLLLFVAKLLVKNYSKLKEFNVYAVVSAVLFFVYPFHSESVFWIIGRSASLGCLFFLLSLIFFLKWNNGILTALLSLLAFEMALLSYESVWVLPVVIALLIIAERRTITKRNYLFLAALWLVFVLHLLVRSSFTGQLFHQYDTKAYISFDLQLLFLNFMRLMARSFLPPFVNEQSLIISFAIVAAGLIALMLKVFKRKKAEPFFFLLVTIWLISYLPYLSLGIDTHGVEGERYLYLPSAFLCLLIVYLLVQLLKARWFVIVTALMFVCCLWFIAQSRSYYIKAGTVTKTTLSQIKQLSGKQKIFIEDLPQYNKGAVVFRLGLEEGVQWLLPEVKSKMLIVSIDDSDVRVREKHNKKFKISYNVSDKVLRLQSVLVKDTAFKKTYITKDTSDLYFQPSADAWLKFTDTSLTIINKP